MSEPNVDVYRARIDKLERRLAALKIAGTLSSVVLVLVIGVGGFFIVRANRNLTIKVATLKADLAECGKRVAMFRDEIESGPPPRSRTELVVIHHHPTDINKDADANQAPGPKGARQNGADGADSGGGTSVTPVYFDEELCGEIKGFMFKRVAPRSFYEELGIIAGDVILNINGERVSDQDEGVPKIQGMSEEPFLQVEIERDGKRMMLTRE